MRRARYARRTCALLRQSARISRCRRGGDDSDEWRDDSVAIAQHLAQYVSCSQICAHAIDVLFVSLIRSVLQTKCTVGSFQRVKDRACAHIRRSMTLAMRLCWHLINSISAAKAQSSCMPTANSPLFHHSAEVNPSTIFHSLYAMITTSCVKSPLQHLT